MKLKSKLRHLLIFLYFLVGRKVNFSKANKSLTRVIVFHHLDKPKLFEKLIVKLKKHYNFISFEDFLCGKKDKSKINLILAFDDGYKSCFTNGNPIFQKYKLKPIFFINSDLIDLDKKNAFIYCKQRINTWPEESLCWKDLMTLKKQGCLIGGHTIKHTDLTNKGLDESHLYMNILDDKKKIDCELNQTTSLFAYPFGRWNDLAADKVITAGYEYAFTSDSGFIEDSKSNFKLLRTNIGMRLPLIARAYIEGCSEILTSDMAKIRSMMRVF